MYISKQMFKLNARSVVVRGWGTAATGTMVTARREARWRRALTALLALLAC